MAANTLRDVFRHGLGEIYDAEQHLLSLLSQLETEAESIEVRDRIRRHRSETQHQIENLERCFELMGTDAPRVRCAPIRGLGDAHREFAQTQTPSPTAREIFNFGLAGRAGGYEIAAYRGLAAQARTLGEDDIRRLLDQNQRQEEEMARWLEEQHERVLEAVKPQRVRAG